MEQTEKQKASAISERHRNLASKSTRKLDSLLPFIQFVAGWKWLAVLPYFGSVLPSKDDEDTAKQRCTATTKMARVLSLPAMTNEEDELDCKLFLCYTYASLIVEFDFIGPQVSSPYKV
jgi:hypothetical protein